MQNKQTVQSAPELQFNVAQLLKENTGATRTYTVSTSAIGHLSDFEVVAPLVGNVEFLRTGPDILVIGTFEATIEKSCGRCLALFTAVVPVEVEEIFYPSLDLITGHPLPPPPDADEANRIDEQHILDLYEVVRQALVLDSESVRYCRPDCKGLCPVCGQDRNVDPCTCADEAIDVRWAGLLSVQAEE
jgi:uncharacterized protein